MEALSAEDPVRSADPVRPTAADSAEAALPLTVEVCRDLRAVERVWRHLERTGICTPYQRFDWIASYATTMAADNGTTVCVLSVQRKGGEPLLFLPLAIQAEHGLRVASPVGGKQANYHCPVMARGVAAALDPETMRRLLCDGSRRAGIDVFVFQNLPLAWQGERNPLVLAGATPSPSNVPKTDLPAEADALLGQIGTSEARRKLRRKETGLAAMGELTHLIARDPAEIDLILEGFFRQKNERLREMGIASPFDDEASQRFVRSACLSGLADGRPAVELHGLLLDGRVIATYGGAVDERRFSCMFNSFDASPEIARFSPGDILLTRLIRAQCALGRTGLDLGIGEARYKRLFCRDVEELVDVFLPVTMKGRLYGAALSRYLALKRTVKQTPWLWSLAKKTRARLSGLGLPRKP